MKSVASGFGGYVDDAAGRTSILRVEVVGDHSKFLHGILGNQQGDGGVEHIYILSAVQKDFGIRESR